MDIKHSIGNMEQELKINRTLVVNVLHITEGEFSDIKEYDFENGLGADDFYCTIEIDDITNIWPVPSVWPITKHIQAIAMLAKENNCNRIEFRTDGPILEGYRKFNWN